MSRHQFQHGRTLDALELKGFKLMSARDTQPGDEIGFLWPGMGYTVEEVETDSIGHVRHRFNENSASNSYHPGELLYVKRKTDQAGSWILRAGR